MGTTYFFGELTTTNDSISKNATKITRFRKFAKLSLVKKPAFIGALIGACLVIIVLFARKS